MAATTAANHHGAPVPPIVNAPAADYFVAATGTAGAALVGPDAGAPAAVRFLAIASSSNLTPACEATMPLLIEASNCCGLWKCAPLVADHHS
jgi:hypothetical protein